MTTGRMFGMCGLLVATAAGGQEPKGTAGGANPGDVVPAAYRMFLVTDNRFPLKNPPPPGEKVKDEHRHPNDRTDKVHCLVCEYGLSPVLAVFVRADPKTLGPDAGVVKLARATNALISEVRDNKDNRYKEGKLAAFVGFLQMRGPAKAVDVGGVAVELDGEYPDDEARAERALEVGNLARAADAANVPFGLAPVAGKAADAWGLKADDAVTVVLYYRLKVVKRWTFPADGPTDDQIRTVMTAAGEVAGAAKK